MAEASFEAELRRELRESVMGVHFDPVILTATLIRWLEGAAVGRAGEGEELVEAITQAAKSAVGAIDRAVGGATLATILLVLTDNLFGDLNKSVNDVADGATQFA